MERNSRVAGEGGGGNEVRENYVSVKAADMLSGILHSDSAVRGIGTRVLRH